MPSIADTYRRTRKVPDLVWNRYVCRPIAAVLVHGVRDTAVTPNQITLASVVVAVASAGVFLAVPGYWGLVAAAIVYELSYVLDCADGMLARLRGTQSTPGHLLDFLMDEIKAYLILAAVSVRLYLERDDPLPLLIGVLGLVALASGIGLTTFQRRPEIAPAGTPQLASRKRGLGLVVTAIERLAKLLIHYPSYILWVAVIGHIQWYLYPYVAVNCLYALRAFASVALRFARE